MSIKVRKKIWRGWYWLVLMPIVAGAAITLLQYAGWSAVISANYGLPSATDLLKEAKARAITDFWLLIGLSLASVGIALACLWPENDASGNISSLLARFTFAVVLVLVSIVSIAFGLVFAGRLLK